MWKDNYFKDALGIDGSPKYNESDVVYALVKDKKDVAIEFLKGKGLL